MSIELPEDYKNVFDYAAIGMAVTTLEGRYLKVNQYFCEFYGYEPHEFSTIGFKDITYPEDLSVGMEDLQRLHLGEIDSFHVEKRYIHKSGEIKWGFASISAAVINWAIRSTRLPKSKILANESLRNVLRGPQKSYLLKRLRRVPLLCLFYLWKVCVFLM